MNALIDIILAVLVIDVSKKLLIEWCYINYWYKWKGINQRTPSRGVRFAWPLRMGAAYC